MASFDEDAEGHAGVDSLWFGVVFAHQSLEEAASITEVKNPWFTAGRNKKEVDGLTEY